MRSFPIVTYLLFNLNVDDCSVILLTTVTVFDALSQDIVVLGSSLIVFTGTNVTPFLSIGMTSVFTALLLTIIEGVFAANTSVTGIKLKNAARVPDRICLLFIKWTSLFFNVTCYYLFTPLSQLKSPNKALMKFAL
ncbi:hypothetical protein D3C73_1201780 [compost metagenome]